MPPAPIPAATTAGIEGVPEAEEAVPGPNAPRRPYTGVDVEEGCRDAEKEAIADSMFSPNWLVPRSRFCCCIVVDRVVADDDDDGDDDGSVDDVNNVFPESGPGNIGSPLACLRFRPRVVFAGDVVDVDES